MSSFPIRPLTRWPLFCTALPLRHHRPRPASSPTSPSTSLSPSEFPRSSHTSGHLQRTRCLWLSFPTPPLLASTRLSSTCASFSKGGCHPRKEAVTHLCRRRVGLQYRRQSRYLERCRKGVISSKSIRKRSSLCWRRRSRSWLVARRRSG